MFKIIQCVLAFFLLWAFMPVIEDLMLCEIELEPDEDWDDEDAFASAGFGMDESYGMWSE